MSEIRLAVVKQVPKTRTSVICNLDNGLKVVVGCLICGGSQLGSAVPRLNVGDEIIVVKIGKYWYCTTVFMSSEEDRRTKWKRGG